jgi:hypothetical protein
MTDHTEMFRRIANAIVDALTERLANDAKFIQAIGTSPWMNDHIVNAAATLPENINELISKEVEKALQHVEISSEQIDDFDSAVESLIERGLRDFTIDAEDVNSLEDVIDDRIQNADKEIGSDDVNGLDDAIDNRIEHAKEEIIDAVKNSPDLMEAIASSLQLTTK